MRAKPFRDVNTGEYFRDIDGTIYVKTSKAYSSADTPDIVNCMVLFPNKQKETRGQLRKKENDVYCEVLDEIDLEEMKLHDEPQISESSST